MRNRQFIFIILLTLAFIVSCFLGNDNGMIISMLFLFITEILYCIQNIRKRITLFVFLVSFFTFLLSRAFISLFVNVDDLIFSTSEDFSSKINHHIYISLYLSLVFVYFGFVISQKGKQTVYNNQSNEVKSIREGSYILCLITIVHT